jgi:hypothetical protein
MVQRTNIYGFWVNYDDSAYDGIRYLRDDLSREEAVVFFDQARQKGSAQFEDDYEKQFILYYESGSSSYILARRL